MSGKMKDHSGERFGKLVAVQRLPAKDGSKTKYLCICDCGNEFIATGSNLVCEKAKSCGCLSGKHGMTKKERLYNIWVGMKQRCRDQNSPDYPRYGGRGISVCNEWINDYVVFRKWALANEYSDDLSIDRSDNDGNYCPENCKWQTTKKQNNNTSHNTHITYDNQTHTLAEWAEILNIPYRLMISRLHNGWSFERIVERKEAIV